LGKAIEGRDEKGIKKTVCAFLKILHPNGAPTDDEFEDCIAYAVECRRRVKEQMNKRKPDDEFAKINLSFFKSGGQEELVFCPESKNATATLQPARHRISQDLDTAIEAPIIPEAVPVAPPPVPEVATAVIPDNRSSVEELKEQHFTIMYGDTGYSYKSILGPYLVGDKSVLIEDPYVRLPHQIQNFVRFCETVVKAGTVKKIQLVSGYVDNTQLADIAEKLEELKQSLLELDIEMR
jgi:ATP-dependent Lon protease